MPYVKPNTFVNGQTLDADDLDQNDQDLKKYINQEITDTDLATSAFDTDDMQVGDYQPITNEYSFATGVDTGLANGIINTDRAYFTSHVKRGRQTDNTLEIWQTLFETAPVLNLERSADIIITFGGSFVSAQNAVQANGFWDSKVMLAYMDESNDITFLESTRAYSFEEAVIANTTGVGVATPSGNFNPFGLSGQPGSFPGTDSPIIDLSTRRWIGFSFKISLTAGIYKFALNVNAKSEKGFTSARTFKAEVFYR